MFVVLHLKINYLSRILRVNREEGIAIGTKTLVGLMKLIENTDLVQAGQSDGHAFNESGQG